MAPSETRGDSYSELSGGRRPLAGGDVLPLLSRVIARIQPTLDLEAAPLGLTAFS